jgi:hypothetical protein
MAGQTMWADSKRTRAIVEYRCMADKEDQTGCKWFDQMTGDPADAKLCRHRHNDVDVKRCFSESVRAESSMMEVASMWGRMIDLVKRIERIR